jgi:hypothetical protein
MTKLIIVCVTTLLIFFGCYWTEIAKVELQQEFEVRERLLREIHEHAQQQPQKPSIEITPPAPEKL